MTVATLPAIVSDDGYSTELVSTPINPTGGRLVAWAEAAHAAGQLGSALAKTSFVPKEFRGKPEECAAAILMGDEIGLSPLQALQGVYVVSGRPGLYARTMVAVVLAAGHEVVTTHKTDKSVTVKGRRRGSDTWIEECWTTERARRAKYTSNAKYETDPAAMLYARAAADVCRQIAPDALAGLAYTVEELEIAEPTTVKVTRGQAAGSPATVRRAASTMTTAAATIEAPAAPVADEPSFDEPVDTDTGEITAPVDQDEPADEEAPVVETITAPQTRMLGALMKELGITSREDALTYCIDVIRRDITSRNELTKTEASAVIDALNADKVAHDAAAGLLTEPTFEDGAA